MSDRRALSCVHQGIGATLFSMIRIILFSFLLTVFLACTSEPERLPDEKKYAEDSSLLVNAAQKFADESDVPKLRTIALAMQTTRTLACIDYNNECTLFGTYLSRIIELTAKGSLSPSERKEIRDKAANIHIAVEEGKTKLHNEWARRLKKR